MFSRVASHCYELERCNQRGGRMLSVLDLIERETISIDLGAHLMATLTRAASFMVGAKPGGAGKTTVMCALANVWLPDVDLIPATPENVRQALKEGNRLKPKAFICHEIGAGPYYAYLWGKNLRDYFQLLEYGHRLATNLHADDIDEAYNQICHSNAVPERHFRAFYLLVFLKVQSRYPYQRSVATVYFSDGHAQHTPVFTAEKGIASSWTNSVGHDRVTACKEFLESAYKEGIRTILDTRKRLLEWVQSSSLRIGEDA
ncbi:MAG TPA: hypothetical protein PKY35_14450 [Candidatus Hydrogenedentes bacterium]|nr:hypothetical protein [Candidatus Hydrogenedentota bacterium]HOL78219.1 hypothetical protein [Candidatus Hydrogenedentota bacterium]HPO84524.1 hypothetical protein [Candidatus Hydrogenedentota bacterium]